MTKKTSKRKEQKSKKTVVKIKSSSDNKNVIWRFDWIDMSGKFAFNINRYDFQHKDVLEKIIEYSSMTWADIKKQTHDYGKSKHHYLAVDKLSKDAKDRLNTKKLMDYNDSIFSFALTNKLRIVGIRSEEFFYVLWYDPNHEVCPSVLKQT